MINVALMPMPISAQYMDVFYEVIPYMLPLFMIMNFILPVYNTTCLIVKEKEARTKEVMRMMGMSDFSYWISWFIYFTIESTICVTVSWIILCINCIDHSNAFYIWFFMWLFGMSVFGQVVVFQAFFSRAKFSGLVACMVFFCLYILYFPIMESSNTSLKVLFGLIP